jgi:hypothetical protein
MAKPTTAAAKAESTKAPTISFNLAKMRAERFMGFPTAHLIKAYEMLLGESPESGLPDAMLIEKLCGAVGMPAPREGGPQKPPGAEESVRPDVIAARTPKLGRIGRLPNLSSIGKWEGRWRRVQFGPTGTASETITLGWDAQTRWPILVPDIVDLPWPYWCRVRDSVHVDTLSNKARKWVRDEETEQLMTVVKIDKKTGQPGIRRPVYNYVDMGDVPGTEHLPTGYFEYFQEQARETNMFEGFGRQSLVMVHGKLRDGVPSTYYEKRDSTDLRYRIAEILGPFAVDMVNEQVYTEEAEEAAARTRAKKKGKS